VIDLASRSACLNAATVPISGLGAPARIATPIPVRAISVRERGAIRPALIRSSIKSGVRIATSNVSPASMRALSDADALKLAASLCSLPRSNCGTKSAMASFKAVEHKTLSSAASAAFVIMPGTMNKTAASKAGAARKNTGANVALTITMLLAIVSRA
jgi:hypothetical protein